MKKIVYLLIAVFSLAFFTPANAQLKFGVKGGLNLSSPSLPNSWESYSKSGNYTGFYIGPMAELTIPIVGLGVDASLLYSQNGFKLSPSAVESRYLRRKSIEIPVNLKYSFGFGSTLAIFVAAGPQFGYALDDDASTFENIGNFSFKKSVVSGNIGLGLKLLKHIQFAVNYNVPFGDTAEFTVLQGTKDVLKGKNKTWHLSLAYLF